MSYVNVNTPFTGRYSFEMGNIRTMVDVAGIAILYAHLIQCCELRVRKELEAVQNVLQNQYAQYKQSKESIELINYKYHDLKHQIAVLRSEADPGKREEFLDKMKSKGIKLAALSSYYHSSEKKKKYENIYVMNYSFVDCEKMEYVAKMITQVE